VSTQKKLVAYHLGRLQDRNAAVRLGAITELALIGDPDALDTLQAIYKTDPDPEVRKAAQDAGRKLFLNRQKGQG
jgi:hypothetical protein